MKYFKKLLPAKNTDFEFFKIDSQGSTHLDIKTCFTRLLISIPFLFFILLGLKQGVSYVELCSIIVYWCASQSAISACRDFKRKIFDKAFVHGLATDILLALPTIAAVVIKTI